MKNILTKLVIVIGIGLLLYFFLNKEKQAFSKPEEKSISVVNIDNSINDSHSIDLNLKHQNVDANEVTFSQSKVNYLSGFCGYNFTDSNILKNDDLSEVQLKAFNRLNDECQLWYEHIEKMPDEELSELKNTNKSRIKSLTQFIARDRGISDHKKISEAREKINVSVEDFNPMALDYLLATDNDLIKRIADYISTKDLNYIKNNHLNITQLFVCDIDPQSCYPDSLESLSECLNVEESCGISTQQEIYLSVSPNQYLDLINIVDSIKILIKEGYFK